MGIESSDEMADFLAGQWLAYGEINTLDQLLESYQKVTREQIEELFPFLEKEKRYTYHID